MTPTGKFQADGACPGQDPHSSERAGKSPGTVSKSMGVGMEAAGDAQLSRLDCKRSALKLAFLCISDVHEGKPLQLGPLNCTGERMNESGKSLVSRNLV